jgi:hypothetical protein
MNSHEEILVNAVSGLNTKIYPMDIFFSRFLAGEKDLHHPKRNINIRQQSLHSIEKIGAAR